MVEEEEEEETVVERREREREKGRKHEGGVGVCNDLKDG